MNPITISKAHNKAIKTRQIIHHVASL